MDRVIELRVKDDAGTLSRMDAFLAAETDLSRSFLQKLITSGQVEVNGHKTKASRKVLPDDRIIVRLPAPRPSKIVPEDIPLNIVYHDNDIIVVDKSVGLVVHPADGSPAGTLVNALLYIFPDLAVIGSEMRPGIVHRLDKDTSGLMVVAKSDDSYRFLAEKIAAREVTRRYLALVWGNIVEERGVIEAPIGRHPRLRHRMAVVEEEIGRPATTRFKVLRRFGDCSLVDVTLVTGRTHQIRVHFEYIDHPLLGDRTYGGRRGRGGMIPATFSRQALHAYYLGFVHPSSGRYVEFHSPMPMDIKALLSSMGQDVEEVQKTIKQGIQVN